MTAEYARSFSARRVVTEQADGGDGAGHPEPAEQAAVAVVDGAVRAPTPCPAGTSSSATSGSQSHPVQRTSSSSGAAGQARLHQVPVAEQHGVGDRAEERGADEEAGDREPGRVAGVERRPRPTPTTPMTGAIRSSAGRELRALGVLASAGARGRCRSWPRPGPMRRLGLRRLARDTPALRRMTDTPSATPRGERHARPTPASRTGSGSMHEEPDAGRAERPSSP